MGTSPWSYWSKYSTHQGSLPPEVIQQRKDYKDDIEQMVKDIRDDRRLSKQGSVSDHTTLRGISDTEEKELKYRLDKERKKNMRALVDRIIAYEKQHNLPKRFVLDNDIAIIKKLAGLK